jgi:hypothetical protein
MHEDNIIIEDGEESISILNIIEAQLAVLLTLQDMPTDAYDKQYEDIVKAMSLAFRVIQKAQVKLLKNL